jgi:hypothetical protein
MLDIPDYKNKAEKSSDANIDVILSSGNGNVSMVLAFAEEKHRRQREREDTLHAELLAEIKRPHWSVTPGFLVGFVAMIAACIAAYPVLFQQPQAQQTLPVIAQPAQTTSPVHDMPASSTLPSSQAIESPKSSRRAQ